MDTTGAGVSKRYLPCPPLPHIRPVPSFHVSLLCSYCLNALVTLWVNCDGRLLVGVGDALAHRHSWLEIGNKGYFHVSKKHTWNGGVFPRVADTFRQFSHFPLKFRIPSKFRF